MYEVNAKIKHILGEGNISKSENQLFNFSLHIFSS